MGKCLYHSDRETNYTCMKHQIHLCEECLECRDSELYCKFRPSCTIWFISKRKQKWEAEDRQVAVSASRHRVAFSVLNKDIEVPHGAVLLEAARLAGVHLNASCNGKGSCGKCKLVVESGELDVPPTALLSDREKARGYVLACQSRVQGDVVVRIPEEALERRLKIAGMGQQATEALKGLVHTIEPVLREIPLELMPPTLQDSVSDLDRLNRGLKQQGCDVACLDVGIKVLRQLAQAVRQNNWNVTASLIQRKCAYEILDVRAGEDKAASLGAAIDVGTTTIVVYLVDMQDGSVVAAASGHNQQAACGDDVINRIICAEKDGVSKLSRMALTTINDLIGEAAASAGRDGMQIKNVVISGNTTMVHLLLKIEPRHIRREPYIPTVSEFPVLKAGEIGLKANPIAAVFVMPGPASYVGGDIVSGLLYAGFHRLEPLTLFIDVGTNGEIVLGNRDWLLTAACSAGPAFEGGGIRWGMRAEEGAIERVRIDPDTLAPRMDTVADAAPRGICGSGMIDLISELLKVGLIDRAGRFSTDISHPRLLRLEDEPAYVLVFANDTPMGEDLVFTQSDLKSLLYSKAAVFAGFTILLGEAGLDFSMVSRMIISGGFGQYLNIEKAISIGMLPDIDRDKFSYLGNTSIVGAYMALLDGRYRSEAAEICNRMTYVDFSRHGRYMEEFTSALFLPHTNLALFPGTGK
jgi:uncharacterized 2Fe-2S/4Fe-4S cluster protein (DUF4445 family)